MRARTQTAGFRVHVVGGNHAVFLAFDLDEETRQGCLGFAIHRTDHTEGEAYWLSGFKTFRSVVPQPSSTIVYTTDKHPIQSMWWGDYTAKPAHSYTYLIEPMYGAPKNLVMRPEVALSVDVTTNDPATGVHGIYFNRGVAASQAYVTRFGAKPDDLPAEKRAEAMTWLSRGLQEAMIDFITRDAGPDLVLRAAVYEFTEPSVLAAIAQAAIEGADVKVVYHAKGDQGATNEEAITQAQLDRSLLIPRVHPVIAHNKYMVRGHKLADGTVAWVELWTGSTNLSQGGIFGHSNVAHVVRDATVAATYVDYWTQLAADPTGKPLRDWVSQHSPFTAGDTAAEGVHTVFSPRSDYAPLDWYAQNFVGNPNSSHITLPFGLEGKHFEPLVEQLPATGPLRFVMLNKKDDHQDLWGGNHTLQIAVGSTGGPDQLTRWAAEHLTDFNPMVPFLHTKILILGALTEAPTVVSGSANFSEASTTSNDENMLVIVNDTEVADVYFTEFTRIFQHFYARWWAAQLNAKTTTTPGADGADIHSFLTEDSSWQTPYWNPNSPRYAERELYSDMDVT
jgi:phosphatidylserine/phosphatidylglycerophosphate/cardiolipin synthase-like enzyme